MSSSATEYELRAHEAYVRARPYWQRVHGIQRQIGRDAFRLMRAYGWLPRLPPRSGDMGQMVDDIDRASGGAR